MSKTEKAKTELNDLPEEILEYIFSLTSPYCDLQNLATCCHRFYRICKVVVERVQVNFKRSITEGSLEWASVEPKYGATISERYSHCAVYHDCSLYIFGGCTSSSTTFNDLWRFDLTRHQWIRPLTLGTYPSPKACASMVFYKEFLVLFGGWSHPTPYPLHQAARFFNQLHVYSIVTKQWSLIYPRPANGVATVPQGIAGHAANVVGDKMVVFGGSHGQGHSCNELWLLDLEAMTWNIPEVQGPKPEPRYGHSQIVLDEQHLLVIGGCGGPNTPPLTDMWLLNMAGDVWTWKELKVNNKEMCPPQLWCRAATKVGDNVVVISKMSRHQQQQHQKQHQSLFEKERPQATRSARTPSAGNNSPRNPQGGSSSGMARAKAPATAPSGVKEVKMPVRLEPQGSQSSRLEPLGCLNPRFEPQGMAADDAPVRVYSRDLIGGHSDDTADGAGVDNGSQKEAGSSDESGDDNDKASSGEAASAICYSERAKLAFSTGECSTQASSRREEDPGSRAGCLGAASPPGGLGILARTNLNALGRTGKPSVRPNALRNRQKQLETLRRYSERLKQMERSQLQQDQHESQQNQQAQQKNQQPQEREPAKSKKQPRRNHNPMHIHVLDIKKAVSEGVVSWCSINTDIYGPPPEETIFYSLHYGRSELILFGGIQTDLCSMQRDFQFRNTHTSNFLHLINARKFLR